MTEREPMTWTPTVWKPVGVSFTLAGADIDSSGTHRNFHEWCEFDVFYDVDPGSPVGRY